MRIDFSSPVYNNRYKIKYMPYDTLRQRIISAELCVKPDNDGYWDSDRFGNKILCGTVAGAHTSFSVYLRGTAETGLAVNEHYDNDTDIFTVQSAYTKPGKEIKYLYEKLCKGAPKSRYDRVMHFMNGLFRVFNYVPRATTVKTTAEEALCLRKGVCQDYAHIMISLLRLDGIPARYVVGMMIGEGASHAWVEVNLNGYWYGIDPTNNLLTDDFYIKISHGRDYRDCVVSKGVFTGAAAQTQSVYARVIKIKRPR
ncbi:MAG: transglutaminase family protein [Firmicutes bacterium]|nr:transglutaminase family protein [Bacillota bacterium]